MKQRDEAQEMRTIQEKGQKMLSAMALDTDAILKSLHGMIRVNIPRVEERHKNEERMQ